MKTARDVAATGVVIGLVSWIWNETVLAGTTLARPLDVSTLAVLAGALAGGLLLAASVVLPIRWSTRDGVPLAFTVWLAVFGIHVVLVQIEALAFLPIVPPADLLLGGLRDLVVATLLAGSVMRQSRGRGPAPPEPASARPRVWWWMGRIALAAFTYLVLYTAAGAMIWPRIQAFYTSIGLAVDASIVLPMQVFRGTLYVVFALPLIRSLAARRWQVSLAMAIMFPILAGVAALIAPNPVFPDSIRLLHLIELGWSNFAFGAFVGFLFWQPHVPHGISARSADPAPSVPGHGG